MNHAHAPHPWYREPMVWLIVAIPAATVVAGLATLAIAASVSADRVADPVARVAQVQTRDLAPDRRAAELGLRAVVEVDRATGAIAVEAQAAGAGIPLLAFDHPIEAARDRTVTLTAAGPGRWLGRIEAPGDGAWNLRLSGAARDWRIAGRLPAGDSRAELGPTLR